MAGHGCQNSHSTGGALLTATGSASLSSDTVVLTASSELPTALSVFTQGQSIISPVFFGDGLRCVNGNLKRLYTKAATGGTASAPGVGDLTISARSAAQGDTIATGSSRFYYTYYRDSSATFCPAPPGNTFNITNSVSVTWGP